MSRQIGPFSAEPLAVMLEWRLRDLDARLREIESRLADWPAERVEHPHHGEQPDLADLTAQEARELAAELLARADAADERTANAGVVD